MTANIYDSTSDIDPIQKATDDYYKALDDFDNASNAWVAMMIFMTELAPAICEYDEANITVEAENENDLSTLEGDLNTIQTAFNDGVNYETDPTNPEYTEEVSEAEDAGKEIEDIVDNNPAFASIQDDVDNQLMALFGNDSGTDWNDPSRVSESWANAWEMSTNDSSSMTTDGASFLSQYTDAFSALSTDFSNMSDMIKNLLDWWKNCDDQMLGIDKDGCMQNWIDSINTDVSNQKVS